MPMTMRGCSEALSTGLCGGHWRVTGGSLEGQGYQAGQGLERQVGEGTLRVGEGTLRVGEGTLRVGKGEGDSLRWVPFVLREVCANEPLGRAEPPEYRA